MQTLDEPFQDGDLNIAHSQTFCHILYTDDTILNEKEARNFVVFVVPSILQEILHILHSHVSNRCRTWDSTHTIRAKLMA